MLSRSPRPARAAPGRLLLPRLRQAPHVRGPDPATHRCDVPQIDYTLVDHGSLRCAPERGGCGRTWTFLKPGTSSADRGGWQPSPPPVGAPRWGQHRARTQPAPTRGDGPW